MEELKQLIELVLQLPATALWILAGYLVYKLAVVGSIYATIRFCVDKVHSWATHRKEVLHLYTWREGVDPISEEVKDTIINSLARLNAFHRTTGSSSTYFHTDAARTLEKLVNEYISTAPAKK